MRKILLTTLILPLSLAVTGPAFATDSGDAAFELLANYAAETRKTDFIKLKSSIDLSDATELDAKFSELYGEPSISRAGLKVWEVSNENGTGAPHTTIMCGPDGLGGIFISADRRGPNSTGAATRNKRRPSTKAKRTPQRRLTRSQERD